MSINRTESKYISAHAKNITEVTGIKWKLRGKYWTFKYKRPDPTYYTHWYTLGANEIRLTVCDGDVYRKYKSPPGQDLSELYECIVLGLNYKT